LARAESQLELDLAAQAQADAALARNESLERGGLISSAGMEATRMDAARTESAARDSRVNVETARADLAAAEAGLRQTVVRAPVQATVANIPARAGASVSPGAALITLAPRGGVFAVARYPKEPLARIRVGQSAEVRPSGARVSLPGVVSRLGEQEVTVRVTVEAGYAHLLRANQGAVVVIDTR
jgi:multidrug resistance efflux pump